MIFKLIIISVILTTKLSFLSTQTQPAQFGQPLVVNAEPIYRQNIGDLCFANINLDCDPNYPYRYMDGRCNNPYHPSWGMANHTSVRLLPTYYSLNPNDRPESPRVSNVDNVTPLPSPRVFSDVFFTDKHVPSEQYTLAFMLMGQVLAHDVMSLKLRSPPQGACCKGTQRVPKENWDRGCLSIDIPPDDRYYKEFNILCTQFTRAQTSDEFGCPLPEFEQGNSVTSFVDLSVVYGSSDEISNQLRLFQQGKLKYEIDSTGRVFLPHQDSANTLCFVETNKGNCFKGSDFRVDQHPQLAVMQVAMLRAHNNFCDELIAINANNPVWQDDEKIFQEAKKILTGLVQNIFFGRYAEILFGPDCAAAYGLTPTATPEQIYDPGYDPELNPGTIAEFQHVALRAFHTLVEGNIGLYDENRIQLNTFNISDWFFNPTLVLQPGILNQIMIGLATQQMSGFDRFYSPGITEELFKQLNNNKFGADLASIDIMRERDCGMAPYVFFAVLAGFIPATNFDELTAQIDPALVELLKKVYQSVLDIDPIACILEPPYGNSMVGKTLHVVLAEQFRRYKYADSKFYTFDGPGRFTPDQLTVIKSSSLSFLMCYGSDKMQFIQRDAFTVPKSGDLVLCETIIEEFIQQLRLHWVEKI